MDSYIGQIRLFAGTYAPEGWALCNGASLLIRDFQPLYALIGTIYGGDGKTTFNVPNLQLVLPVGVSATATATTRAYSLGATGGTFAVGLTQAQLPSHTHTLSVTTQPATQSIPTTGCLPAALPTGFTGYAKPTPGASLVAMATLSPTAIGSSGGSQAHMNAMPAVNLSYIICVNGLFPDLT